VNRYAGVVLFAILALLTLTAQPLALATIRGYHHSLAPVAARIGLRCRFTPTCSR
jgi:putative component of membrane protein insertase Oxa1/YidC/SpoIIIJ protein YidD